MICKPVTLQSIRRRSPAISLEKQVARLLAVNSRSVSCTREMISGLRQLLPTERSLFDRVEAEFDSCLQSLISDVQATFLDSPP